MGEFVFRWTHPADEVYVTGTFDNWSKSEQLEKVGDAFEKKVTLPDASKKIYYKFVVDGNWTTDHTAPQENDEQGNLNNFLTSERITKHSTPATAAVMSGVTPQSTTAELAKSVPLENTGSADLPGSFPETPGATPALEKANFSVNPIPASDGIGNPIKLEAGEKVPDQSEITNNTINSTVRLDKESYENGASAPVLPHVVTPQDERDENGTGVLDLPPISNNLIPESSLPMGTSGVGTYDAGVTIQSAGPTSTTAQLAAAVPLESSKVPETVTESQKEAGFAPEASAVPEEVLEKSEVEKELLKEVPEAPATSEGTGGKESEISENGISAGETAAAVGGAAVAAAYETKDKAVEAVNGKATEETETLTAANDTPEVVKESIAESGQSAEAAAYTEPVAEKAAVEKELLSEVKPEESTGESAPKIIETPAPETSTHAVAATEPTSSTGLNADAASPVAGKTSPESRDISPSTVPGTHTQTEPEVTTGVGSSTTAAVSTSNNAGTSAAPSKSSATKEAETDKKKKRRSFFGQIKDKFTHKKEKSAAN